MRLAWRLATLHGCNKRSGCGRVQVGPITFSQTKHAHEGNSLVPWLSPRANENRTGSDEKLGGAWERGYEGNVVLEFSAVVN